MLLKSKLIMASLLVLSMLSGCSSHLSGSFYSKVDPDNRINKNDPVLVIVSKDDLSSKYYISYVIEKLKENGFSNVYRQSDENIPDTKYIVVVSVEEKIDSYQYSSADYGMVNTGTSNTNCYSYGGYTNCSSTNNQALGITGSSQKTDYIHGYYFTTYWFNSSKNQKVLSTLVSTYEKNCNSDKLYRFLIDESIARLDFNKPMDYKFDTKMPDGYRCDTP